MNKRIRDEGPAPSVRLGTDYRQIHEMVHRFSFFFQTKQTFCCCCCCLCRWTKIAIEFRQVGVIESAIHVMQCNTHTPTILKSCSSGSFRWWYLLQASVMVVREMHCNPPMSWPTTLTWILITARSLSFPWENKNSSGRQAARGSSIRHAHDTTVSFPETDGGAITVPA